MHFWFYILLILFSLSLGFYIQAQQSVKNASDYGMSPSTVPPNTYTLVKPSPNYNDYTSGNAALSLGILLIYFITVTLKENEPNEFFFRYIIPFMFIANGLAFGATFAYSDDFEGNGRTFYMIGTISLVLATAPPIIFSTLEPGNSLAAMWAFSLLCNACAALFFGLALNNLQSGADSKILQSIMGAVGFSTLLSLIAIFIKGKPLWDTFQFERKLAMRNAKQQKDKGTELI